MTAEEQDTLLVLAYIHLAAGEARQAVVLLLLLERHAPGNLAVLRILGHAYTETGMAERALVVLDKLAAAGNEADELGILLLRGRALQQLGKTIEARQCFKSFVALRNSPPATARPATAVVQEEVLAA